MDQDKLRDNLVKYRLLQNIHFFNYVGVNQSTIKKWLSEDRTLSEANYNRLNPVVDAVVSAIEKNKRP